MEISILKSTVVTRTHVTYKASCITKHYLQPQNLRALYRNVFRPTKVGRGIYILFTLRCSVCVDNMTMLVCASTTICEHILIDFILFYFILLFFFFWSGELTLEIISNHFRYTLSIALHIISKVCLCFPSDLFH